MTFLQMVVEADLAHLSIPLRYLSFSQAYLDSALRLCKALKQSRTRYNYARASVVLYLTLHTIELFLKGAILERQPHEKLLHHNIQALSNRYRNLYPSKKYEFRAPFIYEEVSDEILGTLFTPRQLDELRILSKEHTRKNPSNLRHRYPINDMGQPWSGAVGFEAVSFLIELQKLKVAIDRLAELIFTAHKESQIKRPQKDRR